MKMSFYKVRHCKKKSSAAGALSIELHDIYENIITQFKDRKVVGWNPAGVTPTFSLISEPLDYILIN